MPDLAKQQRIAIEHITRLGYGGADRANFSPEFTAWSCVSGMMDGTLYLSKMPILQEVFEQPLEITIDAVTAQPGRVAIQARSKGTLLGGVPYSNEYHFLIEFDDQDRIRHVREYMDSARANEALMPMVRARVGAAPAA